MSAQVIRTTIPFAVPPENGEPAWQNINSDENGEYQKNYSRKTEEVEVENLRGRESEASLDKTGFQLISNSPSKHSGFTEDAAIESEYYPEVIENIKKVTGASRVVIFDHSAYLEPLSCYIGLTLLLS